MDFEVRPHTSLFLQSVVLFVRDSSQHCRVEMLALRYRFSMAFIRTATPVITPNTRVLFKYYAYEAERVLFIFRPIIITPTCIKNDQVGKTVYGIKS